MSDPVAAGARTIDIPANETAVGSLDRLRDRFSGLVERAGLVAIRVGCKEEGRRVAGGLTAGNRARCTPRERTALDRPLPPRQGVDEHAQRSWRSRFGAATHEHEPRAVRRDVEVPDPLPDVRPFEELSWPPDFRPG